MRWFSRMAKICALLLGYCSVAHGAAQTPISTSYCALINDPASFVGKRILVHAIYRYGFEIQRLDAAECCPGKKLKIWVEMELSDGKSKRLFKKFPREMGLARATFLGKFETGGPFGDGGYRYRLIVNQIDSVEAIGHPSEASQPPWEDRNCASETNPTHEGSTSSRLHESGHADPPKPQ